MVTPDGVVKVLDFGVAKLAPAVDAAGQTVTVPPTATSDDTRAGLIVGTAAYMSPEQARGHVVDKRTDIWAFGCVRGTRITVGDVLGHLAAGASEDEILRDFPQPVREDIRACLAYAAERERRTRAVPAA